ncbi:alkaline phosphatase D family protein [Pontibacter harenae]|uniref:alkaline phosphatase D family protein n=1 Tax=Pontibacter harenae TaxID=2894083 RepID=UPI001E5D4F8C|nr:alkaline phosphatase D family protein [Pontibacter harenae]MCC9166246.1 alkaline phosphatase family protein [Pontibacter harenae]
MCFKILILFILSLLSATQTIAFQRTVTNNADSSHTYIAFGSCNNQDELQPLWPAIIATQPDLWVWLGDNIYADTKDMQVMKKKYEKQLQHKPYQQLLSTTPITGTWDDHDFGYDNSDRRFDKKAESQRLFLDFMGEPRDAPIRKQEGTYRSYTLGAGEHKIKIFLLDVRYFKDPLLDIFGLYLPNPFADVLGKAQWQWLEQELAASDAQVNIIASGLQVLPDGLSYTNWSNYPVARNRLLRLIEQTKPAVPILLTGDSHVGELSKINLKGYAYPLYEIKSSGMTHHRRAKKTGNSYRVGEQVGELNFGILDIAWAEDTATVTMQIRGEGNKVWLEEKVVFPRKDFKKHTRVEL